MLFQHMGAKVIIFLGMNKFIEKNIITRAYLYSLCLWYALCLRIFDYSAKPPSDVTSEASSMRMFWAVA